MDLGWILEYCRKKKGVSEDFPFDDQTLVIRVGDKMFLLTDIHSEPVRINLKCDPLIALDLRDEFDAITPGFHMNKVHWNTVLLDGTVPENRVKWMIDHSYELVFNKLRIAQKDSIISE
jgi:predicted DNA-binding protein (MmcQ/YjbR family)